MAETNAEFPTIIGPDATFKGELTFEKGLRLQGKFEGQIKTPGRLHVAKEAELQADVEAAAVIIEGRVKGNLSASDRIELKNSAVYEGDLTSGKLVVDEGASLTGHVTVGPNAAKGNRGGPPTSGGANRPLPPVNNPSVQAGPPPKNG